MSHWAVLGKPSQGGKERAGQAEKGGDQSAPEPSSLEGAVFFKPSYSQSHDMTYVECLT